MRAALHVVAPGLFATVQDLGRPSFQHLGVPASGALDSWSLRLGNLLLGNAPGAAAIEMCYAGVHVEAVGAPVRILIAGPCEGRIEGPSPRSVSAWRSERLAPGETLRLGPVKGVSCAYLILGGGAAVQPVLGSRSTYTRAGLGGVAGRALQAGDVIPTFAAMDADEVELAAPPLKDGGPIRVVLGPQDDHFTKEAVAVLLGESFTVSAEADRIGIRLEGPRLTHTRPADIPSDGTVHGMIQVPPSGQPIILLNDRQTTGGYPKIATVITADLPRVGRLVPGRELRFEAVTPAKGAQIAREQEHVLRNLLATVRAVRRAPLLTTESLLSTNLVSGVVNAWNESG